MVKTNVNAKVMKVRCDKVYDEQVEGAREC